MQWGDFIAELALYVPLLGFWLAAIVLGILGIAASLRARTQPGGIEVECSEPSERGG
jgi:hypothetical protein